MANVPKAITDLPVASAMGDDDLLVVSQNATTSSIKGELIKGYAQNAVASQVTAAQTAATQAGDAKADAETARNEAETSASSAANSASDAESAAAEAEQAKTYIENMDMDGETLPAGSSVTVTKTISPEGNLLFVIGVPQGIQGDKGDTGETGATGPQGVSVTGATVNEDGDLVITLSAGDPINAGSVIGPKGEQGEVGPTGASVDRIERTSGTGAPGTTDTYTMYLTNGQTGGTFQVYNGQNGTGTGDFMADGSVPMTGNLQMGGNRITNVGAPQAATDAVRQSDLEAVSQEVDHILDGTTPAYIPPATNAKIGGVIVGDGIDVEADGTISVTPGLTQSEADERYLQLTGGTMAGSIMASFGQDFGIHFPVVEESNSITIGSGGPAFSVSATNNVEVGSEPTTANGVANKAYVDSKAPTSVTITLTADGWVDATAVPPPDSGGTPVTQIKHQTVTVPGVVASEIAQLITPTPAILSQSAYYEAGIMCTNQAENSLTFTCQTVPTSNLTVYVVIQPLN